MTTTINVVTALLLIVLAVVFVLHGHGPEGAPFVPWYPVAELNDD